MEVINGDMSDIYSMQDVALDGNLWKSMIQIKGPVRFPFVHVADP